ncbi:AmmeMemoRadiSam system protein A [Caproiciproducens galactitolivorans]|uniref:3,4-dihydroxyphenylacetate 2,3-dioxygenase n=1 Tax=Caproiciproducens galactitolivorans TaxID=642589 RepID=A0A4Z0Y3R9_9FIRM|nr:AmmeMemoRadiSam system protein A [Caproiciproducens galactitolivorans]QEY35772.1 AmmeMemoRadiSam system protein A [Caproiciproducens galactitolivorans]TGJ77507.1 3,4-dihydroxyphenylacetate 2,3-dioxygenase [Caproiciproducens galactitolivorans]
MSIVGAFIVPHPPIILPEVGRGEERKIQRTIDAYREAARRAAALQPDTVVVTSPHATLYADYFHISPGEKACGNLKAFGIPGVSLEAQYDSAFVRALEEEAGKAGLPAGTLGGQDKMLDHGTLIPLRFLNETPVRYRLVRIGLSGLPALEHYRLGKCIARTAEKLNRRVVFVASGDLSHKLTAEGPYGFAEESPEFDRQVTDAMAKGDFLRFLTFPPAFCGAAAECGLRSFMIMAGALDGKAVRPELLSYEGPFGVGYAVCSFEITGEDDLRHFDAVYAKEHRAHLNAVKEKEDPYVRLARLSLETFIKTGMRANMPDGLPEKMLQQRAGVFVSLKKYGELRGCIGTIEPVTGNVAEEILQNAVSAGVEDPRFPSVTASELPDLVYSVDVLAKPEPIASISELDVKRYGVIVSSGYKRGLLLPNLEGVDTPEQQVSIAKQKAGIHRGERFSLERFEVVRHT